MRRRPERSLEATRQLKTVDPGKIGEFVPSDVVVHALEEQMTAALRQSTLR